MKLQASRARRSPRGRTEGFIRGGACDPLSPRRATLSNRDALAGKADLERWAKTIPGPVAFHWLAGADHGYRVPKALGGKGEAAVMAEVARAAREWVASLPA